MEYSDAVAVIADEKYGGQLNMKSHVEVVASDSKIIFKRIDGLSDGMSLGQAPEYTKFMIKARDVVGSKWLVDVSRSYYLASDTVGEFSMEANPNHTYIVTMQTRQENGFFGPISVMATVRTKPKRK